MQSQPPCPEHKPPEKKKIDKRCLLQICKHPPKYFTTGRKLDPKKVRDVSKEPNSFWYPKEADMFSYRLIEKEWDKRFIKNEFKMKYFDKPNYKTRQTLDILERNYVPDKHVPDSVKRFAAIDIDPDYFTIVEGRPCKRRFSLPEYRDTIRKTLLTKLKTGYLYDEIMLIDEQFINEQRKINGISKEHKKLLDTFEELIAKDYEDSMSILSKSQDLISKTVDLDDYSKRLYKEYALVKRSVNLLDESWKTCQMYQEFIYQISPISWKLRYSIEKPVAEVVGRKQGSTSTILSSKNLSSSAMASLHVLLEYFMFEEEERDPPLLFFTSPQELLDILSALEKQNLNSLLHLENLTVPLEGIKRTMEEISTKIIKEHSEIKEKIADMKEMISIEEQKAKKLEDYARMLIFGIYKDLLISIETLKLVVIIEDAYDDIIKGNFINLSIVDMMREIELKHESLKLKLDDIPLETQQRVMKSYYKGEINKIQEAYKANFMMKTMEALLIRLRKTFDPPAKRVGRELKWRSRIVEKKKVVTVEEKGLTQDEIDFLNFFTDYCKYEEEREKKIMKRMETEKGIKL